MAGDLSNAYLVATDSEFRLLAGWSLSVRAGRVLTVEASGQVTVEIDDQDGGTVTAWPLNGFSYAVGDVVYVLLANNASDSGIVVGSKAPLPTLDPGVLAGGGFVRVDGSTPLTAEWDIGEDQAIRAERLEARDGEGLRLEDDGGNLGVFIEDGGQVGLGTTNPEAALHAAASGAAAILERQMGATTTGLRQATNLRAVSTGSAADGFGVSFDFTLIDAEAVSPGNAIGRIGAVRQGADNSGAVVIHTMEAGSSAERVRVQADGKVGIGTAAPRGKIHLHDGTAGFLIVTVPVPDGTAITIIPNAAGDVTQRLDGFYICDPSSGTTSAGVISVAAAGGLAPGATLDLFNDAGTNILQLQVAADGAVSLQRTAGTRTYIVSLQLFWQ